MESLLAVVLSQQILVIFQIYLHAFSCVICRGISKSQSVVYAKSESSILLECIGISKNVITWKYQEDVLFSNGLRVHDRFHRSISVFKNDSLYIVNVSVYHEGKFSCIRDQQLVAEYDLRLEVVPTLFIANSANHTIAIKEMHVDLEEDVDIVCFAIGSRPAVNLTWIIDGKNIQPETVLKINEYKNYTFDSEIKLRTKLNRTTGNLSCISTATNEVEKQEARLTYTTYAIPDVYISTNASVDSKHLDIEEGLVLNAVCQARRARPPAKLTWLINNVPAEADMLGDVSVSRSNSSQDIFDTAVSLSYVPDNEKGNITCVASIGINETDQLVHATYRTYVIPTLILAVVDSKEYVTGSYRENISSNISLKKNYEITLLCTAYGARPLYNLSWERVGEEDTQSILHIVNTTVDNKITFNTSISLRIKPRGDEEVRCVFNDEWYVAVFLISEPDSRKVDKVQFGALYVMIILFGVCCVIFLIKFAWHLVKGRQAISSSKYPEDCQYHEIPVLTRSTQEIETEDISTEANSSIEVQRRHKQPSNTSDSTVKTVLANVHHNEIKTKTKLPGDGLFTYWIADLLTDDDLRKTVIAKTLSDKARMADLLNFRALAISLEGLKRHQNLVDLLATYVGDVPYYICQEYIKCGTLRNFLLKLNQNASASQTTEHHEKLQLTRFATDIAGGMKFLEDENCRHPVLMADKVLLNETAVCKLYDFWPKHLSQERINQIFEKKNPPIAWMAPETLFFRQYEKESDVWSLAVVLWEIFSLGETPYRGMTSKEIESKVRKAQHLDQPLACPGRIFDVMLSSWDTSLKTRPSFSELKQRLTFSSVNDPETPVYLDENLSGSSEQYYFTLDSSSSDDVYI